MGGRLGWTQLALAAFAVLAALRVASLTPWPDDWDGIGFVESITRFDMDHFAPHAPGYPVYVALLRLAALVTRDPMMAANLVAVGCGLGAIALLTLATARVFGRASAAWVACFVALGPLVWRTSTAVGSEAPALLFACAAAYGATRSAREARWWIGVAVGMGLGVRVSWGPLFLALLLLAPRGERVRTLFITLGATLAWLVPFVAIVGPAHLVALARTQATGHFEVWGGSVIREPGLARLVWLARDLFACGLGMGRDPLGIVIAALALPLAALGVSAWRALGSPHARLAALLLGPYAAWIALGQNLHQQPRHALPLVTALAVALALGATTSIRARALGAVLLSLIALRTASDAHARRTIPPPGEQLVALARAQPEPVVVFGGPSARFFDLAPDQKGFTVGTFGDARLAAGRLSPLPAHVLVTSELAGLENAREALTPVATLCRPARVDRRAGCLEVFDWAPGGGETKVSGRECEGSGGGGGWGIHRARMEFLPPR